MDEIFIIENNRKFKLEKDTLWERVEESLDDGSILEKDIIIATDYEFKEKCWAIPWRKSLNIPDLYSICFQNWVVSSLPDKLKSLTKIDGIAIISEDEIYRFKPDNDKFGMRDKITYVTKVTPLFDENNVMTSVKFKIILHASQYRSLMKDKEDYLKELYSEEFLKLCAMYWPLEEEEHE